MWPKHHIIMLIIFVVLSEVSVKTSQITHLSDKNCDHSQWFKTYSNKSTLLYIKEMVSHPLVVNSDGSLTSGRV